MLPSSAITSNSNAQNQNNNYKLPSETDKYIEELELHKQLEEDLKDLYQKKETARIQVESLRPDYKLKKNYYAESKDKLDDLL